MSLNLSSILFRSETLTANNQLRVRGACYKSINMSSVLVFSTNQAYILTPGSKQKKTTILFAPMTCWWWSYLLALDLFQHYQADSTFYIRYEKPSGNISLFLLVNNWSTILFYASPVPLAPFSRDATGGGGCGGDDTMMNCLWSDLNSPLCSSQPSPRTNGHERTRQWFCVSLSWVEYFPRDK